MKKLTTILVTLLLAIALVKPVSIRAQPPQVLYMLFSPSIALEEGQLPTENNQHFLPCDPGDTAINGGYQLTITPNTAAAVQGIVTAVNVVVDRIDVFPTYPPGAYAFDATTRSFPVGVDARVTLNVICMRTRMGGPSRANWNVDVP